VSVDERLISRVRSAGSVVGSVSAIGFVDPHFWYQSAVTSAYPWKSLCGSRDYGNQRTCLRLAMKRILWNQ
jgi:hypothetical protein